MKKALGGFRADVAKVEQLVAALNKRVAGIQVEFKGHSELIRERTKKAREDAIPAIAALVDPLKDAIPALTEGEQDWADTATQLRSLTFDSDPYRNAVIKMQKTQELAMLRPAELQRVADRAKKDRDLPTLSLAFEVGKRHQVEKNGGWTGVDLSDVRTPDQSVVLPMIAEAKTLVMQKARLLYEEANGRVLPAVDKLTLAREAQASQLTAHNSAGREPPAPSAVESVSIAPQTRDPATAGGYVLAEARPF
jgi:hypothetical protein